MKRQQTDFKKVVNISEDGKITVLDYVFNYGDGFKGATGSKFFPVSKEHYEERTDQEYITDYLIDSGLELPDDFKRGGFDAWAEAIVTNGEEGDLMFDQSYSELWDMLREVSGLNEDEAFIFECVGGGRCFDKDFQGNVNPELSAIIREFEG